MSDAEWALVRDLLLSGGRCRPISRPGRGYAFFARWRDAGLVAELHDRLRETIRRAEGRDVEPSAAVIDSQSVKADATVALTSRSFDTGKQINGRKRHLLTDTLGLLDVLVTRASTSDRDAARVLLLAARDRFGRLARVWADGGYTGHLVDWSIAQLDIVLDMVRRSDDTRAFQVLPRRWVVVSAQLAHGPGLRTSPRHRRSRRPVVDDTGARRVAHRASGRT
ncbi:transposase [Streptomyces werraensis]|uniref:transposase n=1 Tax=Streptomyces werraensis TaxID=68284 RepID=UPI00381B5084